VGGSNIEKANVMNTRTRLKVANNIAILVAALAITLNFFVVAHY
jgi:hypothetical protein